MGHRYVFRRRPLHLRSRGHAAVDHSAIRHDVRNLWCSLPRYLSTLDQKFIEGLISRAVLPQHAKRKKRQEDRTIRFRPKRRTPRWPLLAMMFFIAVVALVIGLPAASSLASSPTGRTFYVSPMGDDGASGTLPRQAWKTLARVNAATFSPGDRIYFEGPATFKGTLRF